MQLDKGEIDRIQKVRVPELWDFRQKVEVADIALLAKGPAELAGTCRPLRANQDKAHEFVFTPTGSDSFGISVGKISAAAKGQDRLLHGADSTLVGAELDCSSGSWSKHTESTQFDVSALKAKRDAVLASWKRGIIYRSDKSGSGLRTPQLGALHAIASHWTLDLKPGIIVMPTGTGKTEVMVATAITGNCRTVLVVVPSDALRSQTARKFQTLGILKAIGVVPEDFLYPVVATLRHVPKKEKAIEKRAT